VLYAEYLAELTALKNRHADERAELEARYRSPAAVAARQAARGERRPVGRPRITLDVKAERELKSWNEERSVLFQTFRSQPNQPPIWQPLLEDLEPGELDVVRRACELSLGLYELTEHDHGRFVTVTRYA